MRLLLHITLFTVALALGHDACCAFEKPGDAQVYNPYASVLADAGIESTREGLTQYLDLFLPTPEVRAEQTQHVNELLAQLSANSYAQRKVAMHELVTMVRVPYAKLQAAATANDPELRWRCKKVLQLTSGPNPLPEAVCRTIAVLKIKGATATLLRVLPRLTPDHLRRAGEDALTATARREDADLLSTAIERGTLNTKVAAIAALAAALEESSTDRLRPLLADKSTVIRLAAARALANVGDRQALPILLQLLDDDAVQIRADSVTALRGATNQQFGFLAYGSAAKRAVSVQRWKKWLNAQDNPFKPRGSLPRWVNQKTNVGNTIILNFQENRAVELDPKGNVVWEKDGLISPWSVERLPNGNTVIGSYQGRWVAEFTYSGERVWLKDNLPGGVFGLQRLANGNTLLGLKNAKKIIEINPAGETVWEATCEKQPMGIHRTPNGNTMVALHNGNKVVELDPCGKVIWEITNVKVPRTVQRLPNGNTLVAAAGEKRAIEYDREKKVVWSQKVVGTLYDAHRLNNNNTFLSDSSGVYIVDSEGKIVWQQKRFGIGRAIRF